MLVMFWSKAFNALTSLKYNSNYIKYNFLVDISSPPGFVCNFLNSNVEDDFLYIKNVIH